MKKKVLFIVDKPGWAYDDAAKHWRIMLRRDYDIDILYLNDYKAVRVGHKFHRLLKEYQNEAMNGKSVDLSDLKNDAALFKANDGLTNAKPIFDHRKYDGVYFFYHRALCDARLIATPIPLEKVAIAINNEKWIESGAQEEHDIYMKGTKIIVGCNKFIIDNFKKVRSKIFRASQSIDPSVFKYERSGMTSQRVGYKFIVGWSGNYSNKIKNYDLVRTACEISGVKLYKEKDLNRRQLNEWYNKVDAVVCASKSEGGPLMLLEAGAVGLPVITVPVGLAREIIIHGKNGLITKWDNKSIASAIEIISANRKKRADYARELQKEILANWTYKARLYEIEAVLEELVSK